ncbi:TIGR01244 family sulfur transferase [Microbaculum marinisediminis]|uniref:TIGR01244 family sulfur transferase n=1 Tax=Microbaculum marinisediminis TaxID=2931392 RepID=A0AAW5QX28_9HYPH|nr:TIGR01244 family sulfur transferase [Microbaculum sp. A6E488]MCT8972606.1 TIGR01244 family sulfur transferase [Microbaculum sp. A6E488]
MADIVELERGIFIASQLSEGDFDRLPAMGIRAVVANRPDGEAADQLPRAQAHAAARRNGLHFHYHPVASIDIAEDEPVAIFRALMHGLGGPVLFYCGTGTRAALLWAQASLARLGVERTIDVAARAGVDLAPYRDLLEERAALEDAGTAAPLASRLSETPSNTPAKTPAARPSASPARAPQLCIAEAV